MIHKLAVFHRIALFFCGTTRLDVRIWCHCSTSTFAVAMRALGSAYIPPRTPKIPGDVWSASRPAVPLPGLSPCPFSSNVSRLMTCWVSNPGSTIRAGKPVGLSKDTGPTSGTRADGPSNSTCYALQAHGQNTLTGRPLWQNEFPRNFAQTGKTMRRRGWSRHCEGAGKGLSRRSQRRLSTTAPGRIPTNTEGIEDSVRK